MVWTPPRKSCGPFGGHEQGGTGTAAVDWAWDLQEKQLAAVLLVDMSRAVHEQQRSTGYGTSRKTDSCSSLGGHKQGGTGTAAVDWAWDIQETDSCSSLGGHKQGGTGTAVVDWACDLQEKTASFGPLGGHEQGGTGTAAVNWAWDLQDKQLLLSEARTRAGGSGEVNTGEEEL